jgi:hypothetical protein
MRTPVKWGEEISQPQVASVPVTFEKPPMLGDASQPIRRIVVNQLARIPDICRESWHWANIQIVEVVRLVSSQ